MSLKDNSVLPCRLASLGVHYLLYMTAGNPLYFRPDFDVNVRAGRMKRGYTALHLAAENTTNNHQQCLDIFLGKYFSN